jgi:hypothetical protein
MNYGAAISREKKSIFLIKGGYYVNQPPYEIYNIDGFENLLIFYKSNIMKPIRDGFNTLSDEEWEQILAIWNQYKDLL